MNVNVFSTKEYEESPRLQARENKAKQTHFQDAGSDSTFESEEKCLQHKWLNMQKT